MKGIEKGREMFLVFTLNSQEEQEEKTGIVNVKLTDNLKYNKIK